VVAVSLPQNPKTPVNMDIDNINLIMKATRNMFSNGWEEVPVHDQDSDAVMV